jgi:processive 1,2-diacylglycerol beta-glucosyltransferase
MHKPVLAILSVSAGAGHVRAAEALAAAARERYPDVVTEHIDVMDEVGVLFRRLYADSYISIVEHHPALWGYLYQKADAQKHDETLSRFRRTLQRLNTQKFMARLKKLDPERVICTHFLPAELLARKITHKKFFRPVFVQVTDFDVHTLWVQPNMAGYFAASAEVACRMADRGIPPETIHCTGIPIMPVFAQPLSRQACAAALGLAPDRPTLLMMSGGYGIGDIERLAERLLKLALDFQIVALAGRNEALLARLRELAARFPGRLFPMGFTNTIERVMAAADLAITKPGGLTSSECLAMGLPMIVIAPIPGQEERNADYLLENGAALKAYDAAGLAFRVAALLGDPGRRSRMRRQAEALGRPHAAREVLDVVMGHNHPTVSRQPDK